MRGMIFPFPPQKKKNTPPKKKIIFFSKSKIKKYLSNSLNVCERVATSPLLPQVPLEVSRGLELLKKVKSIFNKYFFKGRL